MKKIYALAAALLCLAACNKELAPVTPAGSAPGEGSKIQVEFSVMVPDVQPATKADAYEGAGMGEEPVLKRMIVAVFSGAVLNEWAEASLGEVTYDADAKLYKATYTVMLTYTDSKRYIHFIGNPQHGEPNFNRGETTLLPDFYTDNGIGGYWQRIEVDGIKPEPGVSGDGFKYYFHKADGSETTDPTEARNRNEYYFKLDRDATRNPSYPKFQNVYLARNYAHIVVESNQFPVAATDDAPAKLGFKVTRYALINAPDRGSLAPYVGNGFAAPYQNVTSLSYATTKAGYEGYMPAGVQFLHSGTEETDAPADNEFVTVEYDATGEVTSNPGIYTYERPVPDENPMMVLVGGTFSDDPETEYFYKIEIINDDFKYVPIFRNFRYTLTYKGFTKEDGETDIVKAFQGYAFGDVSSSLATANLTTITDATSIIQVETMEHTFINNETAWSFTYNYYPDKKKPTVTANDKVTATVKTVKGFKAAVKTATASNGVVSLSLEPRGGEILKSIVHVAGQDGGRPIYRDVVIRVMPTPEVSVTVDKLSSDTKGATTTVTLSILADLGSSLFPLVFDIESDKNNLKSTTLPVQSGTSLFSTQKQSFHFVYTLQHSEFEAIVKANPSATYIEVPLTFTTTLPAGSNAGAKVKVTEETGNCTIKMSSDTL